MITIPVNTFMNVTHIPQKDRRILLPYCPSYVENNRCAVIGHFRGVGYQSWTWNEDRQKGAEDIIRKNLTERGLKEIFCDTLGEL